MLQQEIRALTDRASELDFRICFVAGKACSTSGLELGQVLDMLIKIKGMKEDVRVEIERVIVQGRLFRAEQIMRQRSKACTPVSSTLQARVSRASLVDRHSSGGVPVRVLETKPSSLPKSRHLEPSGKLKKSQQNKRAEKLNGDDDNQLRAEEACSICYAELTTVDQPLVACGHRFHTTCLAEYYETCITSHYLPITCPLYSCRREVSIADVKLVLPHNLFDKLEQFTLTQLVSCYPERMRFCPTANCSYAFLIDSESVPVQECPKCAQLFCSRCRTKFHTGMSCETYKSLETCEPQDKLFYVLAYSEKFKQCPLCEFWVEKRDGCDHIQCKCNCEFCYRCGGIYNRCECAGFSNYVEIKEMKLSQTKLLKREALMIQQSLGDTLEDGAPMERVRRAPMLSRILLRRR